MDTNKRALGESIILGIKFLLFCNAFMTIVFWQRDYRTAIQTKNHIKEYKKVKVYIDSVVRYTSGSTSGQRKHLANYYRKPQRGSIEVTFKVNEYQNSDYESLMDYKASHHDSINIWYHPKYKDYYAEEHQVSVEEAFNHRGFINLSILFYIGVLTIIYIAYILIKVIFFSK